METNLDFKLFKNLKNTILINRIILFLMMLLRKGEKNYMLLIKDLLLKEINIKINLQDRAMQKITSRIENLKF